MNLREPDSDGTLDPDDMDDDDSDDDLVPLSPASDNLVLSDDDDDDFQANFNTPSHYERDGSAEPGEREGRQSSNSDSGDGISDVRAVS